MPIDFTDLHAKRDELIDQWDGIDPNNDYYDALTSILLSAMNRQLTETAMKRINDKNHFANLNPNVAQRVFDELIELKKQHYEYSFSLDQILVLDVSRVNQDLCNAFLSLSGGSPAGVITLEHISFFL